MPKITTINSRLLELLKANSKYSKCEFFKIVKKFAIENDLRWKKLYNHIKNQKYQ